VETRKSIKASMQKQNDKRNHRVKELQTGRRVNCVRCNKDQTAETSGESSLNRRRVGVSGKDSDSRGKKQVSVKMPGWLGRKRGGGG